METEREIVAEPPSCSRGLNLCVDRSSVLLVVQFHYHGRQTNRPVIGGCVAAVEAGDDLSAGIHNRGEVLGGLLGKIPHGFTPDLDPDGYGVVFVVRLPDQSVRPDVSAPKGSDVFLGIPVRHPIEFGHGRREEIPLTIWKSMDYDALRGLEFQDFR